MANPFDPAISRYPRNLHGYGPHPPDPRWPGNAVIALQFVLNDEEGGENTVLHGDAASETFLSEIIGAQPVRGARHVNMESLYEYGARAGFWRLHRLFTSRSLPLTVFAVTMALARKPEHVAAMRDAGWEIACHGYRWVDHQHMPEAEERRQIAQAISLHTEVTGSRPLGWYTGRASPNTQRLVSEAGGFLYQSDTYADDLPYWQSIEGRPELFIPYTLDANDMRFVTAQGFHTGEQFETYLRDSFDVLHAEGLAGRSAMLSIGLHSRLVGRPGRISGLARFLDHVARHDRVWIATRESIARHWRAAHPAPSRHAG